MVFPCLPCLLPRAEAAQRESLTSSSDPWGEVTAWLQRSGALAAGLCVCACVCVCTLLTWASLGPTRMPGTQQAPSKYLLNELVKEGTNERTCRQAIREQSWDLKPELRCLQTAPSQGYTDADEAEA